MASRPVGNCLRNAEIHRPFASIVLSTLSTLMKSGSSNHRINYTKLSRTQIIIFPGEQAQYKSWCRYINEGTYIGSAVLSATFLCETQNDNCCESFIGRQPTDWQRATDQPNALKQSHTASNRNQIQFPWNNIFGRNWNRTASTMAKMIYWINKQRRPKKERKKKCETQLQREEKRYDEKRNTRGPININAFVVAML